LIVPPSGALNAKIGTIMIEERSCGKTRVVSGNARDPQMNVGFQTAAGLLLKTGEREGGGEGPT